MAKRVPIKERQRRVSQGLKLAHKAKRDDEVERLASKLFRVFWEANAFHFPASLLKDDSRRSWIKVARAAIRHLKRKAVKRGK